MSKKVRRLAETAVMIAIGTVLSLIKVDMPLGGGVTMVSMLPLIVISHRYGWRWGGFAAFVYSVIQMLLGLDNVRYATSAVMAAEIILLDYIVAYTVIGFSSLTRVIAKDEGNAVALGIIVTFTLRFLCHFITGIWIWDALWPNGFGWAATTYSAIYNGSYMCVELVITMVVAMATFKPLGKYYEYIDVKK